MWRSPWLTISVAWDTLSCVDRCPGTTTTTSTTAKQARRGTHVVSTYATAIRCTCSQLFTLRTLPMGSNNVHVVTACIPQQRRHEERSRWPNAQNHIMDTRCTSAGRPQTTINLTYTTHMKTSLHVDGAAKPLGNLMPPNRLFRAWPASAQNKPTYKTSWRSNNRASEPWQGLHTK